MEQTVPPVCEEKELVVSPDGGLLSSFHWLFAQFFSSVCDPLTASCRIWLDQSEGEPLKLVRMPHRCPDGQDRLRISLIRMLFKKIFAVFCGNGLLQLPLGGCGGGKSEWVCVCVCDGFPGLVGSERRKLMEFSTSKQSLPSNQFNTARLKPTHIHQFWLDQHCDPDACSDGAAGATFFSGRRRGQRSPSHLFCRGFSWSRQKTF